ncbi:MAG: HAMP domain-containing protein [Candidatus Tectomicrobia bacterium]|uniref:HAMP domain-containing protein n=1 Tax=Tectimicrobiota bacterium TaxID=2528274 RepID=A0A932HZ17_UNCTE|nr:HAMP domain-containing protein [Candidatus Tectomicrobia bacterium]
MSWLSASLQRKLLLLVLVLLGLGFGVSALITIETERRLLLAQTSERASIIASTIHKSIRSSMLGGRPDIARSLLDELKRTDGVKALQVFRNDGTEAFTDLRTLEKVSEKQAPLDPRAVRSIRRQAAQMQKMDSMGQDAHFKDALASARETSWMESTREPGGGTARILTFLKPLENEENCQVCHEADSKVRGMVLVSTDVSEIIAKVAILRNRQIAIALATLLAVAFALLFFLRRTVVRPLQDLEACAGLIGQGQFDVCEPHTGPDEIGRLGTSFRKMAASLSRAYSDLQGKNAELERTLGELQESRQKVQLLEAVKDQLSKFVPESVQRLLEENPEADSLAQQEKDITIVFLDLEGYTRMSEMFPQPVVNEILQKYFSAYLEIVGEYKGEINETAGDGLMLIFQDDDPIAHAANAIEASIKIRAKTLQINAARPKGHPEVYANIGINSGVCSVGANKFEAAGGHSRWTFTALGPVTNHSARIGKVATRGRIMIGPETARRVQDRYALVDMGHHSLKNVPEPMLICQVIPTGVIYPVGSFDPVDAVDGTKARAAATA